VLSDLVVQKYISRPLLLNKYKFDFRIYVLVTQCDPLEAYIYRDGLVRLCTHPYEPPKDKNMVII
jgi:tubulin polyglutamylase TTLL11